MHQHVRRFYTNTNNAGDQSDHRVWSITGRLLHTLQASLLDLTDLITDEPPALHVAMQPSDNWGLPDDFAGITIFLASAASDFVTGTAIPIDGGSIEG